MINQARHDKLYNEDFYLWNIQERGKHLALGDAIDTVIPPGSSVFDVGCGAGLFIERLLQLGHEVYGIDGSSSAVKLAAMALKSPTLRISQADITSLKAGDVGQRDACQCIEVSEHLEPQYADGLVSLVASIARHVIVWSAANGDRPGVDHVNCQPPEYWLTKYGALGWKPDISLTARLRCEMVGRGSIHSDGAICFWVLVRG